MLKYGIHFCKILVVQVYFQHLIDVVYLVSPISLIWAKFSFTLKINVLLTPTKSCTVQARRNGLEYYEIESGLDEAPRT